SLTVSAATLLGIISFPSMITVAHAEEVPDNQTIELNQQSEETSAAEETEGQKEAVEVEKTETDALKKERSSVSVELEEAETSMLKEQLIAELHNLLSEEVVAQFDLEQLSNEEIEEIIEATLTQSEEEVLQKL